MKRIAVCISALLVMALLYTGCSNSKESSETILFPVITLKSTGEEINPKYYENGFDFNYDNLPSLELIESEDILEISLQAKLLLGRIITNVQKIQEQYIRKHMN